MSTGTAKGYTLAEVLVVVSILAILAAVALPRIGQSILNRARLDAVPKTAVLIRTAQSLAYSKSISTHVVVSSSGATLMECPTITCTVVQRVVYPPGTSVSGATLIFSPQGLLQSPNPPATLTIQGRRITVSRWGEVAVSP